MAFQKFYAILNVTHERFGDAKGSVCRQDCSQSIECRLHILSARGVISLTLSLLISLVTRSNLILGMRTGRTALTGTSWYYRRDVDGETLLGDGRLRIAGTPPGS